MEPWRWPEAQADCPNLAPDLSAADFPYNTNLNTTPQYASLRLALVSTAAAMLSNSDGISLLLHHNPHIGTLECKPFFVSLWQAVQRTISSSSINSACASGRGLFPA